MRSEDVKEWVEKNVVFFPNFTDGKGNEITTGEVKWKGKKFSGRAGYNLYGRTVSRERREILDERNRDQIVCGLVTPIENWELKRVVTEG